MQSVNYAATQYGYCVQVLDGGQVVHEYSAGNCWQESQTVIAPGSPNAVKLRQLKRWANRRRGRLPKSGASQPSRSNTTPTWKCDFVALACHRGGYVVQKGNEPCGKHDCSPSTTPKMNGWPTTTSMGSPNVLDTPTRIRCGKRTRWFKAR